MKYRSSNTNVATVTDTGVITGVGAGSCTIYAYAADGRFASVKVKVN